LVYNVDNWSFVLVRGAKVGGAEGALAPPIILVFTK